MPVKITDTEVKKERSRNKKSGKSFTPVTIEIQKGVTLLTGANMGGKATLIASATEGAVKKGAMAGNIIKEIAPVVGGKGGGRPTMAQAGGSDPAAIDAALEKAAEVIKAQLS